MALSDRLRKLRENKELKQVEAAAALGMSSVNLNRYETGKHSPDLDTLSRLALFYGVTTDYLLGRVSSPTDSLVATTTEPLDPREEQIGSVDLSPAVLKIAAALESDPELSAFWKELSRRDDLQLLFRQTKSMTPETIRKVMRIIKAIEDEEAGED